MQEAAESAWPPADQDLGVLRRLAAAEQLQPAKDPDDGEVQDSDRRRSRSCLITASEPSRRSRPLCGVLEQYRVVDVSMRRFIAAEESICPNWVHLSVLAVVPRCGEML